MCPHSCGGGLVLQSLMLSEAQCTVCLWKVSPLNLAAQKPVLAPERGRKNSGEGGVRRPALSDSSSAGDCFLLFLLH